MNSGPKKTNSLSDDELARIDVLKKKLYSNSIETNAVQERSLHKHQVKIGSSWEETDKQVADEETHRKRVEEEEKAGMDVKAMYNGPAYGAYGHYSPAEEQEREKTRHKDKKTPAPSTETKHNDNHLSVGEFLSSKFAGDRAEHIQKKLAAQNVNIKYAAAQAQKSIYPDFAKKREEEAAQAAAMKIGAPEEKERYHPSVKVFTVGGGSLENMNMEVRGDSSKVQNAKEKEVIAGEEKLADLQAKEKVSRWSFGTVLFTLVALFFIGALGYAYVHFQRGTNTISPDKIEIAVTGPVSVMSGEVSDFYVDVTNHNNAELIQSDLVVQFPEGTKDALDTNRTLNNMRIDVGTVGAGQTIRQKVSAVFFGEANVKKNMQYSFEFNIADSASIFNKDKMVGVFIAGSPVTAKIINVKEITNNQELSFDIEVVSNSQEIVKNVQLKVEYPFGFKLVETNLKPVANNNIWAIGDIEPLGTKTIKIKGLLIGTNNLEKNFRFTLGISDQKTGEMITVLSTQDQKVFIKQPFVAASLALDGISEGIKVVQYDDTMRGGIVFMNNLKVPLTDVVVEMRLSGVLIDRQSVKPDNGFFRSSDDTVFWDKATEESLTSVGPGETRELGFGIGVVKKRDDLVKLLRRSTSGLVVTIKAKRLGENMVPEEITYGTSRELRLITDFGLESYLQYASGANPSKVNAETVFRFTGKISNTANAVKNTVFTAKLPPNATWKNKYSSNLPTTGVKYNIGKREITLELGEIPSGIGSDKDPVEFWFEFGFTPTLTEQGTSPKIIFTPRIGGVDTFTNTVVESVITDLDVVGAGMSRVE